MGVVGHVDLKDREFMEVIVMEDGEFTFHTALFDTRPPFVFRVPKYAHSASSHALRDGVVAFKLIRCATVEEIALWSKLHPDQKIEGVKQVRVPIMVSEQF